MTYHHDGDMPEKCDGISPDATKHWSALKGIAYEAIWLFGFWINEAAFD